MTTAAIVQPIHRWKMLLFALTAGVMVANLYYVQPLLATVAAEFGQRTTSAGYLVTCTQAGYGLGVLLIVPTADVLDRRRLLSWMLAANVVALLVAAVSSTFAVFAVASLFIGATSAAAMVVVPYVATIAPPASRGNAIGQVMTGLLLGILLARTVSGFVAGLAGWRTMYFLAAGAVVLLLLALRAVMKVEAPRGKLAYVSLLASLFGLVRTKPILAYRAFFGLLAIASFSALWTGLTFLLSSPPYNYPESTIGLFGLVGAAGAISANLVGRLTDKGYTPLVTNALAVAMIVAWACMGLGENVLWLVVVGIFLLDAGSQGLQVCHQSVIYAVAPEARSRVTAIFITACFIGASLGSAMASAAFDHYGWHGICVVGAALPALLLVVHVFAPRSRRASMPAAATSRT